jgi:apolipoprotein N-acyltransferase
MTDKEDSPKRSFWLGWSFGFGHFLVGLYWISISLTVDIVKFGWLMPFAVSLIPAASACYVGVVAAASNRAAHYLKLTKVQKIIVFCLFWVFFEYLRSIFFSGFPWNLIGYSLVFSANISQVASIVGIYGLSLLALLILTLPALLFEICEYNLAFSENSKKNFCILLGLVFTIVAISSWGAYRIESTELKVAENGNVRIVQPSTKQKHKWHPKAKFKTFIKNIELSNSKDNKDINYVVWSESAIPYLLSDQSFELLDIIKGAVPKDGFLVTGALRAQYSQNGEVSKVFNSVFTINDKGKIVDVYDKRHLVPFGEYIPFGKYVPFISKITNGSLGFSRGKKAKTISPKEGFPSFSPLICYEIIFPGLVKDKENQPDFLLNVTNDAWFGRSSGPYQHLNMARVRSIEQGVSLIRAANNGVSALIDPFGRIVQSAKLNEIETLDVKLLEKLDGTVYSKYGGSILFFIIIFIVSPLTLNNFTNVYSSKPNRRALGQKAKGD